MKQIPTAQHSQTQYIEFFSPYITTPTRVTTHSKTLIDNTFSHKIEGGLISGKQGCYQRVLLPVNQNVIPNSHTKLIKS